MKATIYARYSTEKQREASITDQYRNCERYAEREGWAITQRYKDEAVSGSKNNRPGYQQMLADAKAKAFDVLIVDDLSRLSRDDVETKQTIRRFKFWNIRVVGVSDGFDTGNKGYKIQAGVRGLMNEIYLDDLRDKTHRGLTGQALNGNNCGGKSYGYNHVPNEDPTKLDPYGRPEVVAVTREVNPEQAEIVRQIFLWSADGCSPRWIANELNKRGVPSPRGGKWAQSAIYGERIKGTGILNNPLYIGRYVWNRSEWVRHPDTGKRHRRERPESEWVTQEIPALRIVPQPLWDRVKARQREQHAKSESIREALHRNARESGVPKYLFSSLLKCGACGANYVISDYYRYGCATYINRGPSACSNKLKVPREIVEQRLLEGIKRDLLGPEAIEWYKRELARALAEQRRSGDLDADKHRLSEVQRKIANIEAAIMDGIRTRTTKAALEKAEAEEERLEARINGNDDAPKVAELLPRAVDAYREMVEELPGATQRQVARARAQLKSLIGEVRLIPTDKGYLEAEMGGDYAALLKLATGGELIRSGSGGRI